jgi:hypothetical protein
VLKIIQRKIHRIALEESVCMCSGALKGRPGTEIVLLGYK